MDDSYTTEALLAENKKFFARLNSSIIGSGWKVASFPKLVCICGSSRFYDEYQKAEYEETMKGNIYLSIGFYPHSSGQAHGEGVGCTSDEKVALDELHKRKIDLADEVLVLNVGGYIGDSTKSEVEYAKKAGKPIRWLESVGV